MDYWTSQEVLPIDGTSHYPMIENPFDFNQLLEKAKAKISADKTLTKP